MHTGGRSELRPSSWRRMISFRGREECRSRAHSSGILESIARGPQTEAGILDKKNVFACDVIPTLLKPGGIVSLHHASEVTVLESHSFDFCASQMTGAKSDLKAAFRRSMNQVRRGA